MVFEVKLFYVKVGSEERAKEKIFWEIGVKWSHRKIMMLSGGIIYEHVRSMSKWDIRWVNACNKRKILGCDW